MSFTPDYANLQKSAYNKKIKRIPLYDHIISAKVMGEIMGCGDFTSLFGQGKEGKREYLKRSIDFCLMTGYDCIPFECSTGSVMPGSGSLGGHKDGIIKTREDFEKYPWKEIPDMFFNAYDETYTLLGELLPDGMKAVGGPGNGVFECVQDITGYMDLCYIREDDPELYRDLFFAVGDMMSAIWSRFMKKYGDIYAVCRFGDDLGFKSTTLIAADDIRELVIPQYKRIIDTVHSYNKPFLLHSCGCIFNVMDDIINVAGIDAKHSNEDVIAPFTDWVERYGKKIGNFGGVDTDVLSQESPEQIKRYVFEILEKLDAMDDCGGIAIGCGNSIPDYIPASGFMAMNEAVREYRGDFAK